jgi:hypothetical protein
MSTILTSINPKTNELEINNVIEDSMDKERQIAIKILAIIEQFLDDEDITIPDNDRTGAEDEARLYGPNYYYLEDKITDLLKGEK